MGTLHFDFWRMNGEGGRSLRLGREGGEIGGFRQEEASMCVLDAVQLAVLAR